MKKLRKLKLTDLSKQGLSNLEKQSLRGGHSCTDYTCQCNMPSQIMAVVDGYLDDQAHDGYIP